jgi:hypothetical protein
MRTRSAVHGVEFARALDRAFHRLGAGIAEEHVVREARGAQPLGQPLALRDAEQVRYVDELGGLLRERLREPRMRVAERIHGNTGGEVEIALARGRRQPGALAPLEREVDARKSRQKMRRHGVARCSLRYAEMKCAAFRGGTFGYFIAGRRGVNTTVLIADMSRNDRSEHLRTLRTNTTRGTCGSKGRGLLRRSLGI